MEREEGLLTVPDVAEYLRVARITVYKMISAGRIPVTHVGRSVRFRVEDIRSFVSDNTTQPVRRRARKRGQYDLD